MNMKWLEQWLGEDWKVTPAGGATGDAYIAQQGGNESCFFKAELVTFSCRAFG
ncbi:hypothetical protein GCM10020331_031030 [Ectobacillus funiculus]